MTMLTNYFQTEILQHEIISFSLYIIVFLHTSEYMAMYEYIRS